MHGNYLLMFILNYLKVLYIIPQQHSRPAPADLVASDNGSASPEIAALKAASTVAFAASDAAVAFD